MRIQNNSSRSFRLVSYVDVVDTFVRGMRSRSRINERWNCVRVWCYAQSNKSYLTKIKVNIYACSHEFASFSLPILFFLKVIQLIFVPFNGSHKVNAIYRDGVCFIRSDYFFFCIFSCSQWRWPILFVRRERKKNRNFSNEPSYLHDFLHSFVYSIFFPYFNIMVRNSFWYYFYRPHRKSWCFYSGIRRTMMWLEAWW